MNYIWGNITYFAYSGFFEDALLKQGRNMHINWSHIADAYCKIWTIARCNNINKRKNLINKQSLDSG